MAYAKIDTAASAEIIAAPDSTRRIRVLGYLIVVASSVTVTWKTGSTALTGAMSHIVGVSQGAGPVGDRVDPQPLMLGDYGANINLVLGSGVQVSGWIIYDYTG